MAVCSSPYIWNRLHFPRNMSYFSAQVFRIYPADSICVSRSRARCSPLHVHHRIHELRFPSIETPRLHENILIAPTESLGNFVHGFDRSFLASSSDSPPPEPRTTVHCWFIVLTLSLWGSPGCTRSYSIAKRMDLAIPAPRSL